MRPRGQRKKWRLKLAGRGAGKTWEGAQATRLAHEEGEKDMILMAATAGDFITVMLPEIKRVCPPWDQPRYVAINKELRWADGTGGYCYAAENPEQVRGPNGRFLWADEPGKWKDKEAWHNMKLMYRLPDCWSVITTTGRDVPWLWELAELAEKHPEWCEVVRACSFDNPYLDQQTMDEWREEYEGTRKGREELYGDLLSGGTCAYWTKDHLNAMRRPIPDGVYPVAVVMGVDPAVTSNNRSDATGIIIAALCTDGHLYVLADLSGFHTPRQISEQIFHGVKRYGVHTVIVETNRGGDYVVDNVNMYAQNEAVSLGAQVEPINSQGSKESRAGGASHNYEKGLVHHVEVFSDLETEMITWRPGVGKSPNRIDALGLALAKLRPSLSFTAGARVNKPGLWAPKPGGGRPRLITYGRR